MNLSSSFSWLVAAVLLFSMFMTFLFSYRDAKKKRPLTKKPFLSFIIPTYNDGSYLRETIDSIFNSYDRKKMEVFVVNDNSTDNTSIILKQLQKEYGLKVVHHKENMGKAVSVNEVFPKTKGEIVFVVDSDVLANKEGIHDILARFEYDSKIGGVSCRYKVRNDNKFLPRMQELEYNMLSFVQGSYNIFSTVSFWGGFVAFRRKAFEDIGMFSSNFLTEDMHAALTLAERGWKSEQSNVPVRTVVPDNFRSWYKQKLRWGGGLMQNLIVHYKVYLRNPLAMLLVFSYSMLALSFILGFVRGYYFTESLFDLAENLIQIQSSVVKGLWYLVLAHSSNVIRNILVFLFYPLLSLPYVIFDKDDRRKISRYFLIFPYAFVYFPIYSVITAIAFVKMTFRYRALSRGERSW